MPSYVITGASRGIGLEFVRQLGESSDNVVFALVRNKRNATLLSALQSKSDNISVLEADITDRAALKAAAEEVKRATGGTLDQLINNAAYVQADRSNYTLDSYPEDEQDFLQKDLTENFTTNVVGIINTINAFLPLLSAAAATQTAKVITISSGMGDGRLVLDCELPQLAPYAISKAAVNMAVTKYAASFKEKNILFSAISPGLVNTAVEPPTPEQLESYGALSARLKSGNPEWDGLPISPDTSVKMMLDVINGLQMKDTGAFVSHKGNQEWL